MQNIAKLMCAILGKIKCFVNEMGFFFSRSLSPSQLISHPTDHFLLLFLYTFDRIRIESMIDSASENCICICSNRKITLLDILLFLFYILAWLFSLASVHCLLHWNSFCPSININNWFGIIVSEQTCWLIFISFVTFILFFIFFVFIPHTHNTLGDIGFVFAYD